MTREEEREVTHIDSDFYRGVNEYLMRSIL